MSNRKLLYLVIPIFLFIVFSQGVQNALAYTDWNVFWAGLEDGQLDGQSNWIQNGVHPNESTIYLETNGQSKQAYVSGDGDYSDYAYKINTNDLSQYDNVVFQFYFKKDAISDTNSSLGAIIIATTTDTITGGGICSSEILISGNNGSNSKLTTYTNLGTQQLNTDNYATSTFYEIWLEIDFLNSRCNTYNKTTGTSTGWQNFSLSPTDEVKVFGIVLGGNDEVTPDTKGILSDVYVIQVNGTSTPNTACTTCTRVINFIPGQGGFVPEPTDSYYTSVRYYLSYDDYKAGKTKIKYTVQQTGDFDNTVVYDNITALPTENVYAQVINNLTATGTYWVNFQLYYDNLINDDIFFSNGYYFRVATTTSGSGDIDPDFFATSTFFGDAFEALVEASFGDIECSYFSDFGAGMFKCAMMYVYRALIPPMDKWQEQMTNDFATIRSLPPQGYAFAIWDILQSTSSTSTTLSLQHVFPSSSPAYGHTLTLDIGSGVSSTIAQIRAMDIETIEGDPVEKFLSYWNTIWYILFGLWLLHEIFGHFHFELTTETTLEKPENYQRRGFVRGVKSTKSTGGTSIPIKKG